jgi:hemerythrin
MEHISFHGLEDHRAEHQRFRIQVRQLSERAGVRDSTVPLELSSFLLQWFKDHTVQEDSMYSKERRAR